MMTQQARGRFKAVILKDYGEEWESAGWLPTNDESLAMDQARARYLEGDEGDLLSAGVMDLESGHIREIDES